MVLPQTRMNCPGNGIYVVQGEMTSLLTAMKKVNRWSAHSHQVGVFIFILTLSSYQW